MTEHELTERLKQGDNVAREELYRLFAPTMMSLCLRYLGNRQDAEDALQDGFMQVFSSIDKFDWRGVGSLSAWLRRVFTNFVISRLRELKTLPADDVDQLPDAPDDDPPPEGISTDTIMQLIAELPTGYRTVINLFLIEGWSHAEIAARLHIGESTSASQYLRGKRMLQEKIKNYLKANAIQ